MANFVFEKYNSMPEQVEENKQNIKKLCSYIKDAFYTSLTLNTSDSSIAISNTNADATTIDGWLIDAIGNLFKITSGDGTNLLIEYYTSLRGPQGDPGASSNDKGIYITHSQPTLDGGNYILSTGNIDNISIDNIPVQINDIIIYIDSNDEPTSIYNVNSINDTTLTLSKIGDYAKGKQLYLHNINIYITSYTDTQRVMLHIINDNNTPINTKALLYDFLESNGFTSGNLYMATGRINPYGSALSVSGMFAYENNVRIVGWNGGSAESAESYNSFYQITDTILSI